MGLVSASGEQISLIQGGTSTVREPLDVILTTSRAPSMLRENPDRMVYTFAAEQCFVDNLAQNSPTFGTNQIGLLSMGGNSNGVADIRNISICRGCAGADNTAVDDIAYIHSNYPGDLVTVYHDMVTLDQVPTSNLNMIREKIKFTTPCSRTKQLRMKCLYAGQCMRQYCS